MKNNEFNTCLSFVALGFYRGIAPGVTGSLATGATYFGVIESTKTWLEEVNPNLSSHWSHFIAGAIGLYFILLLYYKNPDL